MTTLTAKEEQILELFANVAHAALCEVGLGDIIQPAFLGPAGVPYMEFDTDDYGEDAAEFTALVKAEQIGQAAVEAFKAKGANA